MARSTSSFIWQRPNLGKQVLGIEKPKKKRKSLSLGDRIYIWERPKQYGRICSICHEKITKLSDLELDHTKAFSKGGVKLALAHKDCNRRKGNGSLREIQKRLGLKVQKRKKSTKPKKKNKRQIPKPYAIRTPTLNTNWRI